MRVALWSDQSHALGRINRSLKSRLEVDGHTVDLFDWSRIEETNDLRNRFLTYDRVVGTSLITSSNLFDMSNPHFRSRVVAVAHIGVNNPHFKEHFEHVSTTTPIHAVGAVSLDAINFFSFSLSQPMVYLPCGVEVSEFTNRPPPLRIRRLGFVGKLDHSTAYKEVKRPEWLLDICRLTGCEPVFIHGQPSSSDLYATIDMLVCTSLVEGGPLGIFEAAASGVPVLSTRVGNVARLECVSFFNTPQEAAEIIQRLNADESELASYTRAVTAEVRSRFNWDTLYEQHWRPLFRGEAGSHLNFLEIGTSDFDTCIQTCVPDARGLSVEPVRFYLDRLPQKPGVTKVHQAVSDKNGIITIFYVTPETIEQLKLASWCRGCNSVNVPHRLVVAELRRVLGEDVSQTEILSKFTVDTVRVTDFETLTNEQNVRAIDFLKLDTEGHDCTIMRSVLRACLKRRTLFPRKIQFETNEHSVKEDVDEVVAAFSAEGYHADRGYDTILTRRW